MTPHPWDDLEQRFLRFTIAVKESFRAISSITEDPKIPSDLADKIMNISIGAEAYVETMENEIAEAMENKISHDYKKTSLQQTTGTLTVTDDYTIELPDYMVRLLGWEVGDTLQWEIVDGNSVRVSKVDK